MPYMLLSPLCVEKKKDGATWRGPTILAGRKIDQKLLEKLDAEWNERNNHYETKCCPVDVLNFFEKTGWEVVGCGTSDSLPVWTLKQTEDE